MPKIEYYRDSYYMNKGNFKHFAAVAVISMVVYFILYFVIVQNFVYQQQILTESINRTEFIELKQNVLVDDLKRNGLHLKDLQKVSTTESDVDDIQ